MNTKLWGPAAWKVLHTLPWYNDSALVSEQQQQDWLEFFKVLARVLPCKHCCKSIADIMLLYPPEDYVQQRIGLAQYMHLLHNVVNKKLGKPIQSNFTIALNHAASDSEEFYAALFDFLYFTARNYNPEKRKRSYRRFFNTMRKLLPVSLCAQAMRTRPLTEQDLESAESLLSYVRELKQECDVQ